MDTYHKYNHALTLDDLKKILEDGIQILAIINGEYYELKPETAGK